MSNATAGFLAAFFSSFTLCPTELIKVQLQAAKELAFMANQQQVFTYFSLNYGFNLGINS